MSCYIVHEHSKYTSRIDKYWKFDLNQRNEAVSLYNSLYAGYVASMTTDEISDMVDENGAEFPMDPDNYTTYHIEDDVYLNFVLV